MKITKHNGLTTKFEINSFFRTILRKQRSGSKILTKKPGKKCSYHTPQVIKIVRERIRLKPAQFAMKVVRGLSVQNFALQIILKVYMGLKAHKKRLFAGLTKKMNS